MMVNILHRSRKEPSKACLNLHGRPQFDFGLVLALEHLEESSGWEFSAYPDPFTYCLIYLVLSWIGKDVPIRNIML